MENEQYLNLDEMMVDYAEMTSFNFESSDFLAFASQKEIPSEYSHQKYTFKYGNFDVLDMMKSMFSQPTRQRG